MNVEMFYTTITKFLIDENVDNFKNKKNEYKNILSCKFKKMSNEKGLITKYQFIKFFI